MQTTKHRSSSKGAEAAAQKPHDSIKDSKSKKVSSSSASAHKTDERDRHHSKEAVIKLYIYTCMHTYTHTDAHMHRDVCTMHTHTLKHKYSCTVEIIS